MTIFTESEYEIELSAVQGPAGALPTIPNNTLLGNTSGATAVAVARTALQMGLQPYSANLDRLDGTAAQQRVALSVPSVDSLTINSHAELLASTEEYVQWPADEGGEFNLSSDQVSATDNVLRIERTDGSIVERVWDGVNFFAEWVPLNVVNTWGTPITTGDKLASAMTIMPDGATLHLKDSATYQIDFPLRPTQNVTLDGHGATIRRGAQRASLLTANSNAGTSTVTVANASVFRVGMRAFVVKTAGVLGGHAMVNGTSVMHGSAGFLITNITGNVVTLGGPLQQNCVVGNKLVALDALVINDDPATRINIIDTVFDGNNSQHSDVLDWAAGYGVALAQATIQRCRFINMPNECMSIGSGSIIDCTSEDCWGSFFHASNAVQANSRGTLIQNCYTKNTNTKNNGHDEGVITFSAQSQNIRVRDSVFDNSAGTKGQGVFGLLDSDSSADHDQNFFAEYVVAKNFATILTFSSVTSTTPVPFDRIHISKCTFDTCGLLNVSGKDVTKSGYLNEFIVSDSTFINCWCVFTGVRYLRWLNNTYYWDLFDTVYAGTAVTFATLPTTRIGGAALAEGDVAGLVLVDGGNLPGLYLRTSGAWVYNATMTSKLPSTASQQPGAFYIYNCGDVEIAGGCINGPGIVSNNAFACGVIILNDKFKKTEAGTSTVAYMELNIHDISINSWQGGIVMRPDAWWAVAVGYDTTNWNFTNVNVTLIRDNLYVNCVGLQVPAGAVARNCTIWFSDTADQATCAGVQLHGPQDATKHVGGAAIGCYIPYMPNVSSGSSIRHGLTSSNANNKNCISVGNVLAAPVVLNGTHDSVQANNTVITMAGYTTATVPALRRIGQNKSLY